MLKSDQMEQLRQKPALSLVQQKKQNEPSDDAASSKMIKKHQSTSAERMRAYRQRLREKQLIKRSQTGLEVPRNDSEQSYVRSIMSTNSSTMIKKTRLTSAERMRAYRQRLREKKMTKINTMVIEVPKADFGNNSSEQLYVRQTTSTDSSTTIQKHRLTSAEKMRAYRQRLREKQMITNSSVLKIQDKKPSLTPAEKMRAYRQRLREKQMTKISVTVLDVPKDDIVRNDSEQLYGRPVTTSTDCSTMNKFKKPRLTSAEKMRVYRQRLRVKQMIQNSSILEIQLHSCENDVTISELSETVTTSEPTDPTYNSSCSHVATTGICCLSFDQNSLATLREIVDIKSEIDECRI